MGGAILPQIDVNANRCPFFGRGTNLQHTVFSRIYENSAMKKKPSYAFWKETYSFPKPNIFLKLEA
jgi:hypothetical protein